MGYSNTVPSSLSGFFDVILDKDTPALRPAVKITTTIEKFEALLPQEILSCISPLGSGSARSSGGRPRKSAGTAKIHTPPAEEAWKESSYIPFLYNAYKNAKARRQQMAEVLKKSPAAILLSAEKKAQSVLYKNGNPCFDPQLLTDALTSASCIPARLPENRQRYKSQMLYYMRINPERAFSRAILSLLLDEECDGCMDILFPTLEYSGEDAGSLLLHADRLFQKGRYREAKENYEAILSDRKSPDRAQAALSLGRIYRYGYGCTQSPSDAFAMFREAVKIGGTSCPDAAYELYICERDGTGTPGGHKDTDSAWRHLRKAAEAGSIPAIQELGGMYYAGNEQFQVEQDIQKAEAYYRRGAEKDDLSCEKMYGRCLQNKGQASQAGYWYYKAARRGDADASVLLSELDLPSPSDPEKTSDTSAPPVAETIGLCFSNAQNEMAEAFLTSLPAGWDVMPLMSLEDGFKKDTEGLSFIIFLADEDVHQNMRDLDSTVRFLEHLPAGDEAKKRLIEKVHIYVRTQGDDDVEIKTVDSFNSVNELRVKLDLMGDESEPLRLSSVHKDWFYHIRICNPVRDASQYLLSHAPLFLPALGDRRQKPHIVFIGGGSIVTQLICDMLSVFPVTRDGKPLSVTVISENAGKVQEAVQERMPELSAKRSPVSCDLNFFTLTRHELWELVTTGRLPDSPREKELQKTLFEANYYIVAGSDGRENVKAATWLRGALLSSSSEFGILPFIAVHVQDSLLSRQAAHFSVINEGIGFSWYNNYNLFCFGGCRDLYTFQRLEEGYIEKRSFALHMSWYGDDDKARAQAERDYWCRYYNRDSSRMSALSILYKAFLAGITLESPYDYGQESREALLASPLEEWISDPDHLDRAARMEHERWTYFACSRGWRHASVEQMRSYLNMGNPRQQLYLAKLHPCIVSWQKLPEVQKEYNRIQRLKDPDWKDRDLIKSDYDIVKALPGLLRV